MKTNIFQSARENCKNLLIQHIEKCIILTEFARSANKLKTERKLYFAEYFFQFFLSNSNIHYHYFIAWSNLKYRTDYRLSCVIALNIQCMISIAGAYCVPSKTHSKVAKVELELVNVKPEEQVKKYITQLKDH